MAEVNTNSSVNSADLLAAVRNAKTKSADNSNIGKEDFLKILVSQLKNQDPLNPQNDTEFISQMTQLSTLEQMQTLNKSFENSQTFSLIDKYVYADTMNPVSGQYELLEGVVESVLMIDGEAVLKVGGRYIPSGDVYKIQTEGDAPETGL